MTNRLLGSLKKLAEEKLRLQHRERQVAHAERRLMEEASTALSRLGYRLTSAKGRADATKAVGPRTRALRKTFKCPQCDRRFSLAMQWRGT